MSRGKKPSTEQVIGNMTGKESTLSSKECDCQKSLSIIRTFYEIFQYSMKTSGILEDSKEKGKTKRRKSGGKPARERRRVRRAEARRATTLSTSPSPFDTSTLVIDDVREYMGGGDAWLDMGGHIKEDMVKAVGQKFGNNKFTQAGQLQLGEGDRPECDRQSPSLSNYNKSISLESKEDLSAKPWFFDCIPLQSAKELLHDFGKIKSFLIKLSDKRNGYEILWLTENNLITEKEILFNDGWYYLENDKRRFLSLEVLVSYLELKCNFVALQDKNDYKKASQIRYKRKMERLIFCWYCC